MTSAFEAADPAGVGLILVRHAGPDTAWAQWFVHQASHAGHEAQLSRAGQADPLAFDDPADGPAPAVGPQHGAGLRLLTEGAQPGDIILLVLSRALLDAEQANNRQWAAFVLAARSRRVRLLPVLTGSGRWPAALGPLQAVDLRMLGEAAAEARFARALGPGRLAEEDSGTVRLDEAGLPKGRYPGQTPREFVGDVPAPRREWFYGRDEELDTIRYELEDGGRVVLCGTSGHGKTWLAAEYVHRFASQYDVIAWVRAEQSALIREGVAQLAGPLGVSGLAELHDPLPSVTQALRATRDRVLLIFDNALPDRHPQLSEQSLIPGEQLLRFAEFLPADARAHIVFTSVSSDWPDAVRIPVRPFTRGDGVDFLLRQIEGLPSEKAERFTEIVDGNPWALNIIGHVLLQGAVTADEFLQLMRRDLAGAMDQGDSRGSAEDREYRAARQVFVPALELLTANQSPDAVAAAMLLRLLIVFAPEPIPLAMLTSQLDGALRFAGCRLPDELANALTDIGQRRIVLDHLTQLSLVSVANDLSSDLGPTAVMHRVTRDLLVSQTARITVDDFRHRAHQILCDADPHEAGNPEREQRYMLLWRQLVPSGALACRRVAESSDPCAHLPGTVLNIIQALRFKGELVASMQLVDNALVAWQDLFGPASIQVARLRLEKANALLQIEQAAEAAELFGLVRRELEPVRGEYPSEYRQAANGHSAALRVNGEWAEALEADERAYRWSSQALRPDEVPSIRTGHNYAVSLRMMGRFAEALGCDMDSYQRSMDHPALGPDDPLTLHSINNVARDRRELGEYAVAAHLQGEVVERMQAVIGSPLQQHHLRARKNYAVSLRKAGRYADALTLSQGFVADFIAVYGRRHFETAAAHTVMSCDLRVNGQLDEAERTARTAYEICRNILATHPFTAACAVNLAGALREMNRNAEAEQLDRQALAIFTARLGDTHPYSLAAATNLASDLAAAGRLSDAVSLNTQTLEQSRTVRGPDHPYTLLCAVHLSIDLRAAGLTDQADELEHATLARYTATLGEGHPEYAAARDRIRITADVEPPPM